MDVNLPDGTTLRGIPDGTTKAQLIEKLQKNGVTIPDAWKGAAPAKEPTARELVGGSPLNSAIGHVSEAVGEPVLKAATGAAGAVLGGIGGVATGAGAGLAALTSGQGLDKAREAFTDQATQTIQATENAITRQPRTKVGQAADQIVTYPFQLLAKGANKAGEKTAEVTGSPALGAAVNTGLQSLPAAVGAGAGALLGRGAEAAAAGEELTATGAPRTAPSAVGEPAGAQTAPGAAPAQPLSASGAPRAAPSTVGEGPAAPRGTEPPVSENEARARAYASRNGLDWTRLGAGTRKALTTIAQDASALDKLSPAALRRQAALGNLRVPVDATRGQLERDPVQLRREAIASNTAEGQPIRDVDIGANRDIQANLEVLRGRAAGRRGDITQPSVDAEGNQIPGSVRSATKEPTQVGQSVQGAVREKAKWSKKGYDALYKIARETEPDAAVPVAPVQELLTRNPEVQSLGWVSSWLNKARSVKNLPEGEPLKDVTLNELHDLRTDATAIARTGGKEGHYAGQVVKAIDEAMKAAPEGAAAWKRANDAFRKHQQEFGDQGLVKQLVTDKKGGADRSLALEKTWRKVATGSVEQIRQLKKSLLKGDNPALRVKGAKAWADLRGETVNRILEDARNVTTKDETERAVLTATALRKSISRIPRENLNEILGKGATNELYRIMRARDITTRSPVGGRTTQSGTVPNALVLAEKLLKHIPYGGKYLVGAKHAIQDLGARGEAAKTAQEAVVSPLEQAARDVERAQAKRARRAVIDVLESGRGAGAGAPSQPLSIGDAVRRPPP